LGLIDRIAIIERGIEGTSVYLIRISYLENKSLDLGNDDDCFILSCHLLVAFGVGCDDNNNYHNLL
jgi:hypothetical protein